MQEQLRIDVTRLLEEKRKLQAQLDEIDVKIRSLQALMVDEPWPDVAIPYILPEDKDIVCGEGEPPVEGAIPAMTYRDKDGNLRISLCRTYAGEGWIYTPVADGWITITHENA